MVSRKECRMQQQIDGNFLELEGHWTPHQKSMPSSWNQPAWMFILLTKWLVSGLICQLFSMSGITLLTGLLHPKQEYINSCYYRNHFRFVGWKSSKYRLAQLLPTFAPTVWNNPSLRHVKTMQWSTSLDNTSSASWQTIFYINGNLK